GRRLHGRADVRFDDDVRAPAHEEPKDDEQGERERRGGGELRRTPRRRRRGEWLALRGPSLGEDRTAKLERGLGTRLITGSEQRVRFLQRGFGGLTHLFERADFRKVGELEAKRLCAPEERGLPLLARFRFDPLREPDESARQLREGPIGGRIVAFG